MKNLSNFIKVVKNYTIKYSPEILTGVGIAGMVMSTIMAVKETPNAMEESKKLERNGNTSKLEYAKKVIPCYIPSIVTGVSSVACIIGASKINSKRNAALCVGCTPKNNNQ